MQFNGSLHEAHGRHCSRIQQVQLEGVDDILEGTGYT